MLGFERFGPDLTHVRARYDGATELSRLLADTAGAGLHPAHPSYGFLSEEDLLALAAYLLALR